MKHAQIISFSEQSFLSAQTRFFYSHVKSGYNLLIYKIQLAQEKFLFIAKNGRNDCVLPEQIRNKIS